MSNKITNYACQCGTQVPSKVFESEDGKCPTCGDTMSVMNESVSLTEKRWNCPRCESSFKYSREIQECAVCGSFMDIFAPTTKHGKDKGMLPFGG